MKKKTSLYCNSQWSTNLSWSCRPESTQFIYLQFRLDKLVWSLHCSIKQTWSSHDKSLFYAESTKIKRVHAKCEMMAKRVVLIQFLWLYQECTTPHHLTSQNWGVWVEAKMRLAPKIEKNMLFSNSFKAHNFCKNAREELTMIVMGRARTRTPHAIAPVATSFPGTVIGVRSP